MGRNIYCERAESLQHCFVSEKKRAHHLLACFASLHVQDEDLQTISMMFSTFLLILH
uniref:Uncharacterized protein n=1 Tax=Nelumbo nucifera TaxID=4432 RepID=A0A822Y2H5_NELNU|nr:TPA_asm: hypothetical protein HUJ06_027632 [Nelumbo nucifera]